MKKSALIFGCIAIAATGCHTTIPKRPIPSEAKRFELEVSQQVCNVDALAEEKNTALSVSNDVRSSIAPYQNKFGKYEEATGTKLLEKLNYYEAEIEASYRFVTQHCGAYMLCIGSNNHDEWRCKGLEGRWTESQDKFNALSRDIRVIAAEVEKVRIRAQARHHQPRFPYPGKHCCGTLNNIFTDCCG